MFCQTKLPKQKTPEFGPYNYLLLLICIYTQDRRKTFREEVGDLKKCVRSFGWIIGFLLLFGVSTYTISKFRGILHVGIYGLTSVHVIRGGKWFLELERKISE